ncbi:MAG: DNA primase [Candidatus Sungiibacteriota bacterium]|uniref:DNA primase n=1 Tax=Candidatus Sungiibacteriota bacterium TaxID=2750080 RepID=A0A7T5US22_9BACT|nr:MAG: DNA primase [Candidatus Sungbacteria bacterium]
MTLTPIDDIKGRLDIVDVIQGYVRLQKAGINYKALCPFHMEKTPSFFVSPSRQIWHCFGGCGKGGDIFKFIMEIEGLEFPEALRTLATRAGVVLKREDPAIRSEKNRLHDLNEEATKIFERNLVLTPAVKLYLKKRGVADETIQGFRIGFAPQSWDFLLKALTVGGFKKEEIEKAGLAIRSEDGTSWYDRFRSRVMFPISDANGRVVGFSGRVFSAEGGSASGGEASKAAQIEAKYVNTPQTLLYDKSRVLYGFEKAKNEIRAKNQVIVVEGQMDCIMSHQAGVKNTVAVSGTALTPYQLKILRRLCETLISSFDTDAAGESATKRSLALASQFEFERKIAVIPSGKDPADTVAEDAALWRSAVDGARPVVDFYFDKMLREHDPRTVDGKKKISATLLPLLSELAGEIEKAHWVGELAKRFGIRDDAVWNELNRVKSGPQEYSVDTAPRSRIPTRRELLEERLLTLLTLVSQEVRDRELSGGNDFVFTSALNERLFENLKEKATAVSDLSGHLNLLRFKGEVLVQMTSNIEEEFVVCKRELEKECIKEKLLKIGEEIERSEKRGDHVDVVSLLQDFQALSGKLKTL